jgi:hypothetical protein
VDIAEPHVFLSHASEDKDRFVLSFSAALRERGLDVWLDKWEMLPGDSLVDRIFSEGLGGAAAIVVVLSNQSIEKRWVAEELNAAVVKRIQENTRLIPVVLDGLEPTDLPVSIRHLLFEPVPDVNNFGDAVDRIVRSVLGIADKPPLGSLPMYANRTTADLPGLDRIDALVLKSMGEEAVRDFGDQFRTEEFVAAICEDLELNQQQVLESLEVLNTDRYIAIVRTFGTGLPSMSRFTLTTAGIEAYAQNLFDGYDRVTETVMNRLAGWPRDEGNDEELAVAADVPRLLTLHILRLLNGRGLLKLTEPMGPWSSFYAVSPKLRRLSRDP